MKKEER